MVVKRSTTDFCGGNVQCSKMYPTCAVATERKGVPYCLNFNGSIVINLDQNQHGYYKFLRIKSVNILNGFNGWCEMKQQHQQQQ